MRFFY